MHISAPHSSIQAAISGSHTSACHFPSLHGRSKLSLSISSSPTYIQVQPAGMLLIISFDICPIKRRCRKKELHKKYDHGAPTVESE